MPRTLIPGLQAANYSSGQAAVLVCVLWLLLALVPVLFGQHMPPLQQQACCCSAAGLLKQSAASSLIECVVNTTPQPL
jgi:hypothetical protein